MIQMIVAVAIVLLMTTLVVPAFQIFIQRERVEGFARDLTAAVHKGRSQATRDNVQVVMRVDEDDARIVVFADRNGAGPGTPGDGLLNPLSGAPPGTTDEVLWRHNLPTGISFAMPQSQSVVDGFTPVAGGNVGILLPDGSIRDIGAIRFGDQWENYLEVRVEPAATARVSVRKYLAPGGGNGGGGNGGGGSQRWFTREESGGQWEWYWGKR